MNLETEKRNKEVEKMKLIYEKEKLCKKIRLKLSEYEKDQMQIDGMISLALNVDEDILKTLNSFYKYLFDNETSKTRNDIFEYLLSLDTEFQDRIKENILKNSKKKL